MRNQTLQSWSTGGFWSGLLLAALTSAGIAGTRMSGGNAVAALAANAIATLAAIAIASHSLRMQSSVSRAGPQIAGAVLGIALVHGALWATGIASAHLLVERPAQFVNDVVAALAILCVVWGATSQPADLQRVIAGAAMILLYVATAAHWHLDPIAFHGPTVQQLVALEFTGAAIGIAVFRSVLAVAV
jgi:hypothetical protein